jgi:transcription initiation factor TFIIH subunit 2
MYDTAISIQIIRDAPSSEKASNERALRYGFSSISFTMATSARTVPAGSAEGANHAWEDTGGEQIWEKAVQEDDEGNIVVAATDSVTEAIHKRRKLLERQDYAQRHRRVVRDMIRYVYVIIDASRWTRVKDPVFPGGGTRIDVVTNVLNDFVQEYYDQNPVSHLGFVLVKQGEAEILTQLSGSSKTHKLALQSVAESCASEGPSQGGEFSLQNGLEVAGRSLGHQPRHGSREIVLVTAALSTCDPGYVLTETLPKLQQANIRVSCIALSAEMHICHKLAESTAGTMGVCLDLQHFRDWLMAQCTPPPTNKTEKLRGCEMIPMGFPSRTSQEVAELVHAGRQKTLLARTAFTCPQCQGRNSELPTDCAVCGLKLVLAPHLARSFHHLFPVPSFVEKPFTEVTSPALPLATSSSTLVVDIVDLNDKLLVTSEDHDMACYACLRPLVIERSEILRFQCPDCKNLFCVDCDAYLHNSLHNCPGCLSR